MGSVNKDKNRIPEGKRRLFPELFRESVKKFPGNTALKFKDQVYSYKELDELTDRLAFYLMQKGIGRGNVVAVLIPRNEYMTITALGILKSGASYEPLDVSFPAVRIGMMIREAKAGAVIVSKEYEKLLREADPLSERSVIYMEDIKDLPLPDKASFPQVKGEDDFVILYTSGSTGKAKAVVLTHKNIAALIEDIDILYDPDENCRMAQFASFCFDMSIKELLLPLAAGAGVYIIPEEIRTDLFELEKFFDDNRITHSTVTTQIGRQFALKNKCKSLKHLMVGGEALSSVRSPEGYKLHNEYGPSECTLFVTHYELTGDYEEKVPIGKELTNARIYLLDREGKRVKEGECGEICISGPHLAKGYLGEAELTAKYFTANPFSEDEDHERLYHTGDLARINKDGLLEYMGRRDRQVKIRGFRIEPEEIEALLMEYEGIEDAAVTVGKAGEQDILTAFYQSRKELDEEGIKKFFLKRKPAYMLPSFFVHVERFPLNANGKADRDKLKLLYPESRKRDYEKPRGKTESDLAGLFERILSSDRAGRNDSFFDLGGNSLLATALLSAVYETFSCRIGIRDIMKYPVLKDMAQRIDEKASEGKEDIPEIRALEHKDEYDVSRAQLRIYTAQQLLDDSDDTYRLNFTLRTEGSFDEERCKKVLEELFIRHESLRTSFIMKDDGRLVQKIAAADKESAKKAVLSSKTADFKGKMDLGRMPLFNWIYEEKAISFNFHHIISDGQSAALFAHEFMTLYGGGQLRELTIHQKEAAYRERELRFGERYTRLRESWKELSSGFGKTDDEIVCDGVFSEKGPGRAGHVNLIIPEESTKKADEVCRQLNVTPYVLLLSVYALLLHKYTGSEKIICGSVSNGRESGDLEDLQGMFVNTLPLFLTMSDKKTFRENMLLISERVLTMLEGQAVSLEDIAKDLEDAGGNARTAHGHLIFDHMFVMQSLESNLPDTEGGSTYVEYGKQEKAMYDLSLEVEKKGGLYSCDFEYDKNLFSEESIRVMARHFENLLKNCLASMDESPDKIMMTDSKEIALITGKAVIKAPEKTVVDALWECVKKDPEKTALIFGDSSLSYRELWEYSGILAKRIIDLTGDKEEPQKRAAIYAARGFSMIVSIWAVLRAGYAYVPISPSYPAERIDTILKDCDPACVVCCGLSLPDMAADRLKKENNVIIDFDSKDIRERGVDPKLESPSRDKAAYMIYTSGTTGLPKGVIIEHRQLMSMLDSYALLYGLTEDDRVLQFADYVFDQSVWDIFQILTLGGTLCLIPEDTVRDPDELTAYCNKNKVTAASLTPGLLRLLNPEKFKDLRILDVGGEAPDRELMTAWSKGRDVYNTYGPTENTVNTTSFKFSDRGMISKDLIEKKENLPIGRPIGGSRVYILRGDELCAIGVKGELCIAGDQLARGYHKRDDLNNEKFTPDPLRPGRIYRSGDLARYLPDGNIEFLGRLDDQVKVRGYRIELGECESAIRSIKGIKDATVTVRKNNKGHYEMCGYYTAEVPGSIGAIQIRQALESSLPSYMIPEFLTELSEIPLTINGKVDKKALPEAVRISYKDESGAKSREEKDLVAAFLKVLDLEDTGINDDLLILGGDSIDAIRIASILRKKGYEIDGNTILRYRTVKKIAARMPRKDNRVYKEYGEIIKTPVMRIYESGNAGAGEWFNQSVMLFIKKDIKVNDLEEALNTLIAIHGSLRMILKDGKLKVRGAGETERIKIAVYSGLSEDERKDECTCLHREISLEKGDVIKAALFENEDMKRLFIAIDHYCVDEVSWSLLIGDLDRILSKDGSEDIEKDRTVSFGEWSEKLWEYRESEDFLPEKAYWEEIHERLKANRESNENWLNAYKNPSPFKKGYSCLDAFISKKTRKVLFKAAGSRYHCRADVVLLSALISAANEEGKGKLPVIMLESHGRGHIGDSIRSDHTAGWFTAVYPVLFDRPERDDLIIDIKETLARVPNFGLGYGLLYDEEEDRRGIIFNYLGESRSEAFDTLRLTDESSGVQTGPSNGDPYTITFDIRPIAEGLSIEVRYDNAFSKDMVKSLLDAFVQKLEDMAAALNPEERVYSPSDLTLGCEMDERDWELISSVYDPEKTEALSCLTALQQGMLYHYLSDPDSRAYHLLDELTVYGSIKKDELIMALDILAIRYDALRIRFFNEGTHKPWQIILKEDRPCFTDCSDRYSDEVLKEAYERRFQPGKESLLRVYLCRSRKEEGASALIISMHHIITDGWSFNILIRDLMGYYRALCDGRSKEDLREKALRDAKEGCSFADY